MKHLRYARGNRGRADVQEWTAANALVGDLVLVRMDNEVQPWEIGIVLDPDTQEDNTKRPGLHVPAGVPGREKVSNRWHGVHGRNTYTLWDSSLSSRQLLT